MKKQNCENWEHYLTVGSLKKSLRGLSNDTPVFYERIEDVYFTKNGWDKFSLFIKDWFWHKLKKMDSEYIRAFAAFKAGKKAKRSGSKKTVLLITAHY